MRVSRDSEAFHCQRCGHCCYGRGGIVLGADDRARLADHLGITQEALLTAYAEWLAGKLVLSVRENGYCVFFDNGCSVHSVKPRVCKAWPFFRGNMIDETSWRMAQDSCPGINPDCGHEAFVRQGRTLLVAEGLLETTAEGPEALRLDVDG